MTTTGFIWDQAYTGHATSRVHPERPERVEALSSHAMLDDLPGLRTMGVDRMLGAAWVGRVHDPAYVATVKDAHAKGKRFLDQGQTVVRPDTYDVALAALSGTLTMVRAVAEGRYDNGFVACRPPGHHASETSARGFCVFNNVAVAARFAQQALGLSRVLIIDWDVHPADGTAAIFYEDPSVHVLSIHQHGIFTEAVGTEDQRGRGEGEGTTYNIPLDKRANFDDYRRVLEPALDIANHRCRPDLVLISCGFDAHAGDPIGSMCLDDDSYRSMTRMVTKLARRYAGGRVVSVLEGGYNPPIVKRCTRAHIETLMH